MRKSQLLLLLLILTRFLSAQTVYVYDSICNGESILLEGELQTTSGTYVDTLLNQYLEDSIVVTELFVRPTYDLSESMNVCEGESYTFPDGITEDNITSQLVHVSNLSTNAGCDSIITSTINVNPTYALADTFSVCEGGSYTFHDGTTEENITSQVVHVSNLSTANGCDSIVTTTINVNPTYAVTETFSICSGESFTFPDGVTEENITSQLVHESNLTVAATGCDSIVTITINVNPTYALADTFSVCEGGSFTFADGTTDDNITSQVVHVSSLTSSSGCDSTVTTTIDINPEYNISESFSVCSGNSYTFPDGTIVANIISQVVHVSNLATYNGCDSIITTTINIYPVYDLSESFSVCSGNSYTFHDGTVVENITSQVVHVSSLTSADGCDSIITTTINIYPVYDISESFSICPGESYTFPDGTTNMNITSQLVHVSSLSSSDGCDSVVTTTIDINPEYDISESFSVCPGENYTFPDGTTEENITSQVVHFSSYATVNGCDSIITTTINIFPVYDITDDISLCSGANFTFPDGTIENNITSPITHVSYLLSSAGCDSTITTTVSIIANYDITESFYVCPGESYTFPDGSIENNITNQVVHVSNLISTTGCDSIITTTINIATKYNISESYTICAGESFTFPDETTVNNITAQMVYVSNLSSYLGCDSIITTTLYVNPTYTRSESYAICAGESYTFPDGTTVDNITSQLVHVSNLPTTITGCDSIITTTINVNPVYDISETDLICYNTSYTFPDGTTENNITNQVVHVSNLSTYKGCDSVITTTVQVVPEYNISETVLLCSGGSFTFPDGTIMNNITSQVVHVSNLSTSVTACDSIITTTIDIVPFYNISTSFFVCEGGSFTFPDGTTENNITSQVTHISNLISSTGCDSIITTTINVAENYNISETFYVCEGESYTFHDGTTVNNISSQLTHVSNLSTVVTGCDSIISTTINIYPAYNISESFSICEGGSYTFHDGTTVDNITNQLTHVSSLSTTITGCDSIITTTVDIIPGYTKSESFSICKGESFTFPDGTTEDNITSQLTHISNLSATISGCDSIITTTINITPTYSISESSSICEGESYTFPDGTTEDNITSQVIHVNNLSTSLTGCDSIITTTVNIIPKFELSESVYICKGESYTFPDKVTIDNITSQVVHVSRLSMSSTGCDLNITTTVKITPDYIVMIKDSINAGESYMFPDSVVQNNITEQIIYTCNLTTKEAACDSIVTTVLNIKSSVQIPTVTENDIKIFPNPSEGLIQIESTENISNIEVFSSVGMLLWSDRINSNYTSINLTGYTEGFYIIRLYGNEFAINKTVVIE